MGYPRRVFWLGYMESLNTKRPQGRGGLIRDGQALVVVRGAHGILIYQKKGKEKGGDIPFFLSLPSYPLCIADRRDCNSILFASDSLPVPLKKMDESL